MRTRWLLVAMVTLAPVRALAGEPTEFDGWAFGTARADIVADPGFLARCQPVPDMPPGGPGEATRITCPTYQLPDLGAVRVALLFSGEETLRGYVLYIAPEHQGEVRARLRSAYGPPTRQVEQGRTVEWRWASGTAARLTILCRGLDGCLTVKVRGAEPQ